MGLSWYGAHRNRKQALLTCSKPSVPCLNVRAAWLRVLTHQCISPGLGKQVASRWEKPWPLSKGHYSRCQTHAWEGGGKPFYFFWKILKKPPSLRLSGVGMCELSRTPSIRSTALSLTSTAVSSASATLSCTELLCLLQNENMPGSCICVICHFSSSCHS